MHGLGSHNRINYRGQRMQRLVLALLIYVFTGHSALAASIEDIVAEARNSCEGLESGTFHRRDDAVISVDINGDGETDTLIDESAFSCSSSASLFAANGGSILHALVGGGHYNWQALGWRLVEWGEDTILLLARHGTYCGGHSYAHCYEAIVFNGDRPGTVATQDASISSADQGPQSPKT